MLISELIEQLQCTLKIDGDIKVVYADYFGGEEKEVTSVGTSSDRIILSNE